jgi:hypothetical protein
MFKIDYKQLTPHALAIALFIAITLVFFYPMTQGKRLVQNDVMTHAGNSKECHDFREIYDTEPLWTNSSFGGLPAYNVSMQSKTNLIVYVYKALLMGITPASFLFIALVGFYILLLAFRVEPWLAAGGAVAFGLSSYFIIIIGAGHSTKTLSLALMAPVIAGVVLAFRGKYLTGAAITGLAMALLVRANHLQIIYYLLMILILYGIFQFWQAAKEKAFKEYFTALGVLCVAAMLAVGTHSTHFMMTYQYSDSSTRGESELTDTTGIKTSGLDKDYITDWSYGVAESWTLLIPKFMGGASTGALDVDSEVYEVLKDRGIQNARKIISQVPIYWGEQPMQSGPVYLGAIMCFLFVLGLLIVKGPVKWWLLSATILSIVLAWGKNFPEFFSYNVDGVIHNPITDFFLDNVPMYDKFRVVSTMLIIAQLTVPLLGILALKEIFQSKISKAELEKKIKISLGIVGGICLVFALMPGSFFEFTSATSENILVNRYKWPPFLIEALEVDRKSILQGDALRSLIFIFITAGGLWLYVKGKVTTKILFPLLIALIFFDLVLVDKEYLNADNFEKVTKAKKSLFTPTEADMFILSKEYVGNEEAAILYQKLIEKAEAKKKDAKRGERQLTREERMDLQFTALNFNSNYRVMNLAVSTFNDATTSYYHKSVGGYHGAKMKRWQELTEHHLGRRNQSVMDMLNTKYLIIPTEDRRIIAQENQGALGNCWFVEGYRLVKNADDEIAALGDFSPWELAIVDKRFEEQLKGYKAGPSTGGTITMEDYKPNRLIYKSSSRKEELAVFSEIYYQPGWNAYIDGEPADHMRVNYVLRAMVIPEGEHDIEFKFEPSLYGVGENISLASSALLIILLIGLVIRNIKGRESGAIETED